MTETEQQVSDKYKEFIDWLFSIERFGSKLGLKYVRHLLSLIGDPHNKFRSIHITGTNGKGSTTAMIASILRAEGYKVGMYTSPNLQSFTERIVVNNCQIPIEDVVRIAAEVRPHVEKMASDPALRHPTSFEIVTAMAFKYFAEQNVDFVAVEVGMGGDLDATNVVQSIVSVITNVSLEHTEVLGRTVLEIAEKKAGIIKENGVLVTATENEDVFKLFREVCRRTNSRIFRVGKDIKFKKLSAGVDGQSFQLDGLFHYFDRLFIPLLGDHQLTNAATAVGAVEALKFHDTSVSKEAIEEGLMKVKWPGRLEIMQMRPLVVLDSAKDAEAARAIKDALLNEFKYNRLIAVVSISSDKDIPAMIGHLVQVVDYFVITAHRIMCRAAEPSRIAKEVQRHSKPYEIVTDVRDAVRRAIDEAQDDDMVIIVGSVFLVGEARELWVKPQHSLKNGLPSK